MKAWFNIDRFAFYNGLAIVLGGLLAAVLLQPDKDFGPVRASTYLIFFVASTMLAQRFVSIVRRSEDGKATLFVVASCWWWLSFAITTITIEYLLFARALGFWPHWGEDITERFSYFFITGSAVGVLFKAVTFRLIPKEMLMGQRVSAWPFNLFRKGNGRYNAEDGRRDSEGK